MGHLFSSFRQKVVIKTDRRIRIMNEILNGIRVIKMYAWEIPFSKLVDESRTYVSKALSEYTSLSTLS